MAGLSAVSTESYGIHWFRRDLRVAGNPALRANWERFHGRVLGLFVLDSAFLSRPDFSVNRFQFFLKTLEALQEELRSVGGDLYVVDRNPHTVWEELWTLLIAGGKLLPSMVSWNRDYEPFARERDSKVKAWLESRCECFTARDHLVLEPQECLKPADQKPYQVYTPFQSRWVQEAQGVRDRVEGQRGGLDYLDQLQSGKTPRVFRMQWSEMGDRLLGEDVLQTFLHRNQSRVTISIPQAGSQAALRALRNFKPGLSAYSTSRDFPARAGTSRLSLFFKNGSITTAGVICELGLMDHRNRIKFSGEGKFLAELIWREFYYHILFHFPLVESSAFQARFNAISWENREDYFDAWKLGRTGFPIVDAGMRELRTTGWMHNRVRMIVASFLTKDLLIDWRWGERYFMEQLLDGDLAPNNGGWQWAASTGCDPQPYFRIFNPWLQSEKFDNDGVYIKRFLPELSHVEAKNLHRPGGAAGVHGYPEPIVDHSVQRVAALELFSRTG